MAILHLFVRPLDSNLEKNGQDFPIITSQEDLNSGKRFVNTNLDFGTVPPYVTVYPEV